MAPRKSGLLSAAADDGNGIALRKTQAGTHRHFLKIGPQLTIAERLPAGGQVGGNLRNHVIVAGTIASEELPETEAPAGRDSAPAPASGRDGKDPRRGA